MLSFSWAANYWSFRGGGQSIAQLLAHLLPDSAALGSCSSISKKISEENIVDDAKVNQRHCLVESEQWLENVDRPI